MSATKPLKKFHLDIWVIISIAIFLAYGLFLLYPLFSIAKQAVYINGSFSLEYFYKFFGKSVYLQALSNSFSVTIWSTLLSLAIGIPMAYFYNLYDLKAKTIIQMVIILCCMSAPFIGAYSWILLMGRSGIVTVFIEGIIKGIGFSSFRMPSIYGFNGILLVLTLQLFPLVFLYVSGALKNIDNSLLEASDNLGCSGIKRFFKVVIPLCMPTILAAALLVFMRAFADFGTPLLIGEGYTTFPVLIYDQYFGEVGTNKNFASAIAVIAIVITAVIFLAQKWLANRYDFKMNALHPIERKKTKGFSGFLMHAYTYIIVGVAFLPQIYVMYTSFLKTSGKIFVLGYSFNSYIKIQKDLWKATSNTFVIGGAALIIVVVLAILIAYLVVRRRNTLNNVIDVTSMLPYIIPGSVVGIALVVAFNAKPLVLTGTAFIMVVALVIRRLPYTIRSSIAILQQIPLTVEEAAISLGSSKLGAFFKVTTPMMANGILSGAILSWVTIITELATAIILYNRSTITLTLAIYTQVSRGSYGTAAALATILNVLTVASLLLFMRVSKTKEITF